jgi:mannose-6-phosphate isomerase-like protein (cupin superfamily)
LHGGSRGRWYVTFLTDSVQRSHRETTEVYYILEGRGKMELNNDVLDVEPDMVIYIEPNTAHRRTNDRRARWRKRRRARWRPRGEPGGVRAGEPGGVSAGRSPCK